MALELKPGTVGGTTRWSLWLALKTGLSTAARLVESSGML